MRKTVIMICLLLVMVFSASVVVGAASSDPIEMLREQEGVIEKVVNLLEQNKDQTALEELDSLHSAVIEARADIKGWKFESKKGPKLTNPFKLPTGVYRVHFTTEGYAVVKIVPFKGGTEDTIFELTYGRASEGVSTIYRSTGEKIMVNVTDASMPYTLVFEKLE